MVDRKSFFSKEESQSIISEIANSLRTNLYFLESKKKKTVLCTSTIEKEGKSFVAANYAISAAENGEKVLLIDCDVRRPRIHLNFGLEVASGINDVLLGKKNINEVILREVRENLDILPSKHQKRNVTELFLGEEIRNILKGLKRRYDLIIIDTPPLLVAADAAILGQHSDGVIYICGYGMVDRKELIHAKRILKRARVKIYGIVVNKIEKEGYSVGNYGYYSYSYKYSEKYSEEGASK